MKTDHPAWGYRRAEDGSVEHKLFLEGRPEGWFDSPARVPDDEPQATEGRVFGKPDDGKSRRSSDQVDADEALQARADAADIELTEGLTVAEVEAALELAGA